jgi:hypothetical protein
MPCAPCAAETRRCYCPWVLCPKRHPSDGCGLSMGQKDPGMQVCALRFGLHQRGIGVLDMVVAQKVQHAMHDQMGDMIGHRLALRFGGLAGAGVPGNRDIAQFFGIIGRAGVGQGTGAVRRQTSAARSSEGQLSTLVGCGLPRKSAFSTAMRASSQPRSAIWNPSGGRPSAARDRPRRAARPERQAEGLPAGILEDGIDQFDHAGP